MSVKHAADVPAEPVNAGTGTTRQVLIGPDEGPHFALRRFIMQPGAGIPRHTNTVEHEQYVLCGRARIGVGDRVLRGDRRRRGVHPGRNAALVRGAGRRALRVPVRRSESPRHDGDGGEVAR